MAYRHDPDLEFLRNCDNDDLKILTDYLTTDKDGEHRWAEELTYTDKYKKYYPHSLAKMYEEIANELQCFGGDTIVNMFRGGGVPYREILMDVAAKADVNFNKNSSTERIEELYLQKIVDDAIEKMSPEELKEFIKEFGGEEYVGVGAVSTAVAQNVVRHIIRKAGFEFYKLVAIIANKMAWKLLGRGLTFGANAAIIRGTNVALAWLGPIMWVITAIWTLKDITSPAYRVTTPCVIHIIYMRVKMKNKQQEIK